MKNRLKFAAAVLTVAFALSGVTAFAQSSETAAPATTQTETVIEDNRTLTPKGNAQLVDDISDNENLQFITVTARDGNVFYFVIDKGANSQNVYFLNTVDENDLAALVEDYTPTNAAAEPQKPNASASPEPEQTEQEQPKQQEQKKGNGIMLYIVLALIAAGVIGGYYYKVILPKKKLEDADDIEDFELEETESEEISDEDGENNE